MMKNFCIRKDNPIQKTKLIQNPRKTKYFVFRN